jgi:multiple sugar transport system substrate-binding protein/putative aldouronate transport system substrate-binding protein
MKKISLTAIALVAGLAFAQAAFAGAQQQKPASAPAAAPAAGQDAALAAIIPKETLTLQVFSQLANYSGLQTGWFADVLLKKFNVKFNIINQPAGAGVLQTRMESGNLGDLVIWGNDQEDYVNAYKANLLFNWDDEKLLDTYGAYIKANMPFALEKNRLISGGKLYGFGHAVSASATERQEFFYTWDFRYDLYEKLGKPAVNTLDDVVKLLADMKRIEPKDDKGNPTYGVSLFNDWDGNMVMYVKSTATAYYGFDEFDFGLYDPSTGTYHNALEKNGPYLTALKFYNQLYQKGLLDPDSQTQKYDGQSQDFQNGTAFFTIFNWMGSGTYNTDAHLAAGKAMYPIAPAKATPIAYGQNVYGGNRIWSIGAKTEYPELCMAILNWLSTPEGFMTSQYGPRGAIWDIGPDGKITLTDLGKKTMNDPNQSMEPVASGTFKDGAFQINNITWSLDAANPDTKGETYNKNKWPVNSAAPKAPIEAAWRAWAKANSADQYLGARKYILAPGTMFTEDPIPETLKVKWNQIADSIKANSWKAIYAKTDAEFDQIVAVMDAEVRSYGWDEIQKFSVAQAARRTAAEKAVTAKK